MYIVSNIRGISLTVRCGAFDCNGITTCKRTAFFHCGNRQGFTETVRSGNAKELVSNRIRCFYFRYGFVANNGRRSVVFYVFNFDNHRISRNIGCGKYDGNCIACGIFRFFNENVDGELFAIRIRSSCGKQACHQRIGCIDIVLLGIILNGRHTVNFNIAYHLHSVNAVKPIGHKTYRNRRSFCLRTTQ